MKDPEIMKGREQLSCEDGLEESRLRDISSVCNLKRREGCKKMEFFSVVPIGKTRGSGHKMKCRRFLLDIRKFLL